jgi:uncharacterized membrane protein HdeD (DUF308 family)
MSATSTQLAGSVKKIFNWTIALSILLIIAGVFAMILPPIAGLGVTMFVGWMLLFSGVAHIVYGWQAHEKATLFWELLLGLVYIATAVYLLWNPVLGLASLTFGLAIYLLVEAILEFVLAIRLRPLPGSGWLFFDSIVSLILAFLIWRTWPLSALWVIGTLVGLSMIFSGTARLMISLAARKVVVKVAAV